MFLFGWFKNLLGGVGGSRLNIKRGFLFDGSNDKIDLASAISLTGNFTISFWAKINADGSWSICGDQTNFANGRFAFNTNTSSLRVDCAGPITGAIALDDGSADGRLHFFTIIRSTTLGLTIYRDLIELGTDATFTGTININRIGYRPDDSGFPAFNGLMRELRIYSRAITVLEMNNLYDGLSISATSLQGYWKMNESQGTTVIDYSGNGRNGTIANHTPATFFTSYVEKNLFNDKIVNGNFTVLSGDEPGTPWVVSDGDVPTSDVTVASAVCRLLSDAGSTTSIRQNSLINKFDPISVIVNITNAVLGSLNIGSGATANARFQQAISTLGQNIFTFITDSADLLVKRTSACDIFFNSVILKRIRNRVINGDFRKVLTDGSLDPRNWGITNGAGYTVGATGGVCTIATTVAQMAEIYQTVLVSGKRYRATFYISAITGTARIYVGGTLASYTTTGWKSIEFTAASATVYFTTLVNPTSFDISSIIIEPI